MSTLSFWQSDHRDADGFCDVAIVGGGVVGASTAYWLRRQHPALRVALFERGLLASGATGRNAGFVLQGVTSDFATDVERYGDERAQRLWAVTRASRDGLLEAIPPERFGFEASGSLTLAATPEEDDRLRRSARLMYEAGLPSSYLPPGDVAQRTSSKGFYGGLLVPTGGMLDPVRLVRALAEASGAALEEQHPVLHIAPQPGGFLLETPRRRVRTAALVLAANAYAPQLVPALSAYVRPVRAQMLATEPMRPRWLPAPVYSHDGYFYLRQKATGELLLGGARHRHAEAEVGYDDAVTEALQRDLHAYLAQHFPQAEGLAVTRRWSGTMGFSPDGLPSVGPIPDLPGAYFAAGFTGHGLAYGFRVGQMLAEFASGVASPADADLFDPMRLKCAAAAHL